MHQPHENVATPFYLSRNLTRWLSPQDIVTLSCKDPVLACQRGSSVETLRQDLRFAGRILKKNSGFTFVAVLTIALGIGATSGILALVNAVLIRPVPFPDPDRVVLVWETQPKQNNRTRLATLADFLDWRDRNHVFQEMSAWVPWSATLTGQSEPEELPGARASTNFFDLLGVKAAVGRSFLADEEQPGHDQVVILSYRLWKRRFGADPNVVGQPLRLDEKPYIIVGVLPSDFSLWGTGLQYDLWVPLSFVRTQLVRDNHTFAVFARLKPSATLSTANSEMDAIVRQLAAEYPATDQDVGAQVIRFHDEMTEKVRPALQLLFLSAFLVLVIGWVNVANLLLSRALKREKEMALRASLGAGHLRLLRQLLTESMVLSLAGGALGVVLAAAGVYLLQVLPLTKGDLQEIPYMSQVHIDPTVLAFTLSMSILGGVLFGLVPAIHVRGTNLNDAIKSGGSGSQSARRGRNFRSVIVVAEVALSLLLLVSATLLIRSFAKLASTNIGFSPKNLLTFRVRLPESRYSQDQDITSFFEQLEDLASALPGAKSAGMINLLPLSGWQAFSDFEIEGRPTQDQGEHLSGQVRIVDSKYFRTMGIPLLKGRDIGTADRDQSPAVALINETLARRYWLLEDPIGRHFRFRSKTPRRGPWVPRLQISWITIIGVVADSTEWQVGEKRVGMMYLPCLQNPSPLMTVAIRTSVEPTTLISAARNAVELVDKNQPVTDVKTMDQYLDGLESRPRFNAMLVGLFSGLATVLAAIGIYGVMSYAVTQQTRDIGIRMALGAQRRDVLQLVVYQGMQLALIGIAVGLVVGLGFLPPVLSTFLYGVSVHDPMTLLSAALLLFCVAFTACYFPARRAAKVEPLNALRQE